MVQGRVTTPREVKKSISLDRTKIKDSYWLPNSKKVEEISSRWNRKKDIFISPSVST